MRIKLPWHKHKFNIYWGFRYRGRGGQGHQIDVSLACKCGIMRWEPRTEAPMFIINPVTMKAEPLL